MEFKKHPVAEHSTKCWKTFPKQETSLVLADSLTVEQRKSDTYDDFIETTSDDGNNEVPELQTVNSYDFRAFGFSIHQ
jgi:hypothetical protein